jgi:zinc protease
MRKPTLCLVSAIAVLIAACSTNQKTTETTTAPMKQQDTVMSQSNLNLQQEIPNDPDVRVGQLDNGLTYYIENNSKPEDMLELRLVLKAGSVLETDDQQGLAHFMEHMNFNGSRNFDRNELIDYLQGIGVNFGADLNAYTSFDETVYELPLPSDDPEELEKGFLILEDWAWGAKLEEEAIDEERGIVLEESRTRLGANDRMNKVTYPVLFYKSRYADRLPIGKDEVIKNFDYESLRQYYRDWYRPDLMAVVAVGDVNVDEVESKIKEHFGDIPKRENPKPRPDFDLPNHDETLVAVAQDDEAAFAQVRLQYKDREESTTATTVEDYKQNLTNTMFSYMINNRLGELSQKPNPPFIFASSSYGGTVDDDKKAYSSFAQTSATGQMDALQALLEENERVKRYGFQKSEFERAKKEYLAYRERSYKDRDKQESGRLVRQYVQAFLNDSKFPSVEWTYEMSQKILPTIQLEDVNALVDDYIHDDNRVVVFTGPTTDNKPTEQDILNLIKQVEDSELEKYEDTELRDNLIEDLPAPGTIVGTESNEELGTTTLVLSNDVKVTYKKTDFKNDEILMSAYSPGGSSLFDTETNEKTSFIISGLSEAGLGGLSQIDLNKMMSGKLVRVSPQISSRYEGFGGSTTPKDLETMFQMVHLYFTSLNKDEEAIQGFIQNQKSFLGNLMASPNFYFGNEIGKFRYKNNPRYLGFPTEEKFDNSDYDLAYEKYQERFADASDFHFYLVGNVDEQKVKDYAAKYLANLPNLGRDEQPRDFDWRPETGQFKKVVRKGTEDKATVQIVWDGETDTFSPVEDLKMKALAEVTTIKILEELREKEAGIYGGGARGGTSAGAYPSYNFSISFPCGPDNVDRLVAAAMAEVEKIKENGPTEKDLNKAKEGFLLDYKESLESNRFWLANLEEMDRENIDPTYFLDYEEQVKAMTANDVQEVANKYLDENYFLAVLLPEE